MGMRFGRASGNAQQVAPARPANSTIQSPAGPDRHVRVQHGAPAREDERPDAAAAEGRG